MFLKKQDKNSGGLTDYKLCQAAAIFYIAF